MTDGFHAADNMKKHTEEVPGIFDPASEVRGLEAFQKVRILASQGTPFVPL